MSNVALKPDADGRPSQPGEPTWEMASLYPRQGEWSVLEYLQLDVGRLIEFDHGQLEFLPVPTLVHQRLVMWFIRCLQMYLGQHEIGGEVLPAPCPMKIGPEKYREPDALYVTAEHARGDHPEGAVLVMEVVSEGAASRKRDLEQKPIEYAAAGIGEYWVIDPASRSFLVYTLERGENAYLEPKRYSAGDVAQSRRLPGFTCDVTAAFRRAFPAGE